MSKYHVRKTADGEIETISYYESKAYKMLCVAVAGFVRMAAKTGREATYRYLREQLGTNEWLSDAVESCKAAGLIAEKGSAVRTIFVPVAPARAPRIAKKDRRQISITPAKERTYPDLGL